ncbi:MAG: hypothetical protein IJ468_14860 [Lachnospiraceae bacterium]|nr:hypothetical protein [Lachnospiraceae bacterium]
MQYKRVIKFQYYRVRCKRRLANGSFSEPVLYNLTDWIERVIDKQQKGIVFGKNMARIDIIKYNRITQLWGIRLLKLRDTNPPTKAKDGEASVAISLEEDEYIGEDVTMLYERSSSILMVQSNRFSLGISKIEEFINYMNMDEDTIISIDPIGNFNNRSLLENGNYKSLEVSFANLNSWEDDLENKSSLRDMISSIRRTGGYTAYVKIGLGRTKGNSLDKNTISDFIYNVIGKDNHVKRAKVKVESLAGDEGTELVDLIEEVFHDYITFELESKETLKYEDTIMRMTSKFKERKDDLYSAIKYK